MQGAWRRVACQGSFGAPDAVCRRETSLKLPASRIRQHICTTTYEARCLKASCSTGCLTFIYCRWRVTRSTIGLDDKPDETVYERTAADLFTLELTSPQIMNL